MNILRIDMADRSASVFPIEEDLLPYYGGRLMVADLCNKEVPPLCNPWESCNRLVLCTGSLAGLSIPGGDRLSVGAKSPLTNGIKEANAGGSAGRAMAWLGYRGIVVEGVPDKQDAAYLLVLNQKGADLVERNDLKYLGTFESVQRLQEEYGKGISAIVIGPAGEYRLAAAGVAVTDKDGRPSRYAGRGGLGSVMGSKKLKAIILISTQRPEAITHRMKNMSVARKALVKILSENPVTGQRMAEFGTSATLEGTNAIGCLPTRNFTSGNFEKATSIDGKALRNTILERKGEGNTTHACMAGCSIRCSNVFADENGKEIVSPLEYETLAMMGANLGIGSLDSIAELNRICNDLGLDTIEMGATLGVAMGAGLVEFGDYEGAQKLLKEVENNTPLGRILGNGVTVTTRSLGVSRVPAVKGQAIPAFDPRALKGTGVTYATSPMGADHTSGLTIFAKVDPHGKEAQAKASIDVQILRAAYDALGLCNFLIPATGNKPEAILDLLNASYGLSQHKQFLTELGKKVLSIENEFNRKAGFNTFHNRLPDFFHTEPLPPYNLVFDIPYEEIAGVFREIF